MMSTVTCPQSIHDQSTKCSVTVLIPCLNESKTIERCVTKARSALTVLHEDGEVLVVDNGSTDDTVERATSSGARVVMCSAKGYGSAVRFGIDCARGEYIVMADGDDSYDLAAIEPFIRLLREGADLVIGDRFAGTIMPGAMPWLHRYIGSPALTGLLNLCFWSTIGDINCGMRSFTKSASQRIALNATGMEFASEHIVRAIKARLRIAQTPIVLYPDGRMRPPHLRPWRDGFRHLWTILRERIGFERESL
jgi:glycosyltransferase involved in cell wall biosynthesis